MYLMYDATKKEFFEINSNDYESTLQMMQCCVDGLIEHISYIFPYKDIDVFANEEGLLKDLPICSYHEVGDNGYPIFIRGNLFFARSNDEGETIPLTKKDIEEIKDSFYKERWVILKDNLIDEIPVFIQ